MLNKYIRASGMDLTTVRAGEGDKGGGIRGIGVRVRHAAAWCSRTSCSLILPLPHHPQDLMPPRDAAVRVRVLQNHGTLSTSASAKVDLVKGSVHSLARGEAEHLIRMGVLQALDNY